MAIISIKDLPDNVALDRKAMRDISGGARYRSGAGGGRAGTASTRGARIVDFRTGVARPAGAAARQAGKQPK